MLISLAGDGSSNGIMFSKFLGDKLLECKIRYDSHPRSIVR